MIGSVLVGEIEQKTNNRFRNVEGSETFIHAMDVDDHSQDVVFTRWLYELYTL